MDRNLLTPIKEDLKHKLVLLSGPRQVGKTTLSRGLGPNTQYLNFDDEDDRRLIMNRTWDRSKDLIVLDELHKKPKWKSWLKGIYDTEGIPPSILVTGSARMDIFKKGGDSLAGRHFSYRLHPFSVAELKGQVDPDDALRTLLRVGGFPEPFLKGSEDFAKRWRRSHIDKILKEDLIDLEQVRQVKALDILVDLLSDRVGSPVSYNSLARDLEISPHTVKRWIEILEALYVVFVVPPYSKNLARAILKEPKIYFYDTGKVKNDPGARFENVVACSLLKDLHMREDLLGEKTQLHYLRDKEKREVDFLTIRDRKIDKLVEVKISDDSFSKSLLHYSTNLKATNSYQVVLDLKRAKSTPGVRMISGKEFLLSLEDIS